MNTPLFIFVIIETTLSTIFMPLYQEELDEGGEKWAQKLTNNIVSICVTMTTIVAILGDI